MPSRGTKESFVAKARKVHGERYGYDNVVYTRSNDKVDITCYQLTEAGVQHGIFQQTPNDHLNDHGCRICAIEERARSRADDLTNRTYGRLRVKRLDPERGPNGQRYWFTRCDPELGGCRKDDVRVMGQLLTRGDTTSCGCVRSENATKRARSGGKLYESHTKYSKIEDFFASPNCLNSYWAGFIAADGCVHYYDGRAALSIQLARADRSHLEKFLRDTQFTGVITEFLAIPTESSLVKRPHWVAAVRISKAHKWLADLEKHWSIIPAKSLILDPPNLVHPDHIVAFIAGYLDGDGSIMLEEKKTKTTLRISFVGTKQMLEWIKLQLGAITQKQMFDSRYKEAEVKSAGTIFRYALRRVDVLTEFFQMVHRLNLPLLGRKWCKTTPSV